MMRSSNQSRYVLITPARNEENFIEGTVQSVISQTVLPFRWIIVNDGSTDLTRNLIERRAAEHDFMRLVNLERTGKRDFARKVMAFNHGLSQTRGISYDFVGNLDADVTFAPDYFEWILGRFKIDGELGLAGGIIYTRVGNKFFPISSTIDSVTGSVQLFRKACFDQIGGYRPLEHGGVDAAAEIIARMKGWKVRKFLEQRVYEHRRRGTATATPIGVKIELGRRFHSLGYDIIFYLFRCVYRLKDRPVIIGSIAELIGYLGRMAQREPYVLPMEVIDYLRLEQRNKLRAILSLATKKAPVRTACRNKKKHEKPGFPDNG